MQLPWNFKLSPAKYASLGRDFIIFPILLTCPACHANVRLDRHGFYSRNALTTYTEYRIEICRYLCQSCRTTISLLPTFLLPHYQRCCLSILEAIRAFFCGINRVYRQLAAFYLHRFRRNMNSIIIGFRERDPKIKIPDDDKEKAIKLLDLLSETLTSPSDNDCLQTHRNFMALSL